MLTSFTGRSDRAIVRRVLRGRRDDFALLVERYYGAVWATVHSRVAITADAEDIAQEAFVRAYSKLDTLQDPARFGPWLTSIARNTALNWATRRKESVPLESIPETAISREEPSMERRERAALVREHLARLDDGPREILFLHYFAGKSLREIAALANISREAAAKRLQRARAELGTELLETLADEVTQPADDRARHTKAIMAAVLAAPAAWQAAAQMGAAGTYLAGANAKAAALLFTAMLAMGGGWLVVSGGAQLEPEIDPVAPVADTSAETTVAPDTSNMVAETPEESALPTHGPGKITVQCVTIDDKAFEGAEVSVELVDWEAHELPPEQTVIRHGVSDVFGRAVFENLPLGTYHTFARAEGRVGLNDSFLSERRLEDKSRRVVMYPAETLRGRIVTPEGNPVPGAVIYPMVHKIYPDREISHTEMAGLRRITNEGGLFRYDEILKGALKFYVLGPEGQQIVSDFVPVPSLKAKIVLGRSGVVHGRAIDAETGAPIPGMKIQIRQGMRMKYATTTDAEGMYTWPDVAPGSYLVQIDDTVRAPMEESRNLIVPESGGLPDHTLQFTQGGTVRGKIVDKITGAGIPKVKLYAGGQPLNHQLEEVEHITNIDGNFTIQGLGAGMITVQMSHSIDGYVSNYEEVMAEARPGQTVEGLTLYAMPGAPVTGFVVDANGNAVAGATVAGNAHGAQSGIWGNAQAVTEVDGSFRLTQLPGNTHMNLSASKGSIQSEAFKSALPQEGVDDVLLKLDVDANGIIEGTALTAARTPISRGNVYARLISDTQAFQAQADTDAIGYFKLEGLMPGEYRLTPEPWRPDYNNPCSGQTIRIQDGQHLKDIRVYCHPPGDLMVTGRVLQPNGAPVLFAMIQEIPNGHRVITENSGYFELGGLDPGLHTFQITMQGFSPAVMEVEAGTQNLVVRLEHYASFQGRVFDAATGAPIQQYRVNYRQPGVEEVDARPSPSGSLAVDNADGAFTLEKLAADQISLQISADGYTSLNETVDKLAGGESSAFEFFLEVPEEPIEELADSE